MTMENIQYIFVLIVTLCISAMTLLTGFGIGTVLTPTFALLYDVKTAIFLVAIVHIANNVLKFGLFFRSLDTKILLRFGGLSLVGSFAGSLLYGTVDESALKVLLGLFLVVVGISEFRPSFFEKKIPQRYDMVGGLLSGFMGGLIGNQGAIRSAYLLNYNLSKEAFIATATGISLIIDLTRIPMYVWKELHLFSGMWSTLLPVILIAFVGTLVGKQLLKRISLERFRLIVAAFVMFVGLMFLIQASFRTS